MKSHCCLHCSDGAHIREHAHRRERAIACILQAAGTCEEGTTADGGETCGGASAATTIAGQMLRCRVRG